MAGEQDRITDRRREDGIWVEGLHLVRLQHKESDCGTVIFDPDDPCDRHIIAAAALDVEARR